MSEEARKIYRAFRKASHRHLWVNSHDDRTEGQNAGREWGLALALELLGWSAGDECFYRRWRFLRPGRRNGVRRHRAACFVVKEK